MPDSAWLDAFFGWFYRHNPVSATFIGVHDFDDLLPDLSWEGSHTRLESAHAQLASLPQKSPSLDSQLAEGFLRIQAWEATSHHFNGNPVHFTGEAIFGVVSLLLRAPVESAAARLHAIPALLEVGMRQIKKAPLAWIERARYECTGAHLFLEDVAAEFPSLREAGAVADAAFARFGQFLPEEVFTTRRTAVVRTHSTCCCATRTSRNWMPRVLSTWRSSALPLFPPLSVATTSG